MIPRRPESVLGSWPESTLDDFGSFFNALQDRIDAHLEAVQVVQDTADSWAAFAATLPVESQEHAEAQAACWACMGAVAELKAAILPDRRLALAFYRTAIYPIHCTPTAH